MNNWRFMLVYKWVLLRLTIKVIWIEFIEVIEVGLTVTLLGVAHLLE